MLDIGHALASAGNDDIGHARFDHHRGIRDRLEPRSATAIQLITGHFQRQTCREPRPVADGGGLGIAISLAENDIIDALWVNAGPFDQRL